jgi:acyl-ACP thioesterase
MEKFPNNFSPYPFARVESHAIRAHEVTGDGKALLPAFTNLYFEAAINHAQELGLDLADIAGDHLTWVISRLYIEIIRFPFWREKIWVHTWPVDSYGKFAIRDFEFFDRKGNKIASGTSSNMLMNTITRRSVDPRPYLSKIARTDIRALDYDFPELEAVKEADEAVGKASITVRRSDLDINGHVNASQYLAWALESVPEDYYGGHRLRGFEIAYRAETFHRDAVLSESYFGSEGEMLHRISRKKDGRELSRCRSKWVDI